MLTVTMTRDELARFLDRLWENHEPGLVWDGRQDAVTEIGVEGAADNLIEEVWHTPKGTVIATGPDGSDVTCVEVKGHSR